MSEFTVKEIRKGEQDRIVVITPHEEVAEEMMTFSISNTDGYFELWENGFDEPIQSGGTEECTMTEERKELLMELLNEAAAKMLVSVFNEEQGTLLEICSVCENGSGIQVNICDEM